MSLIFGLLFICTQVCFGLAIFGFFDPKRKLSLLDFFLSAAAIGILAGSYIILIFALATHSLASAIFIYIAVAAIAIIARFKEIKSFFLSAATAIRNETSPAHLVRPWLFLLILIMLAYTMQISRMLVLDGTGALKSTLPGWGDTALHISMINKLAISDPFELTHPLMGGANLTYPFIINFMSAIFLKLGAAQLDAFRLPLYIFGIIWIILLFSLATRLLKSKYYALLAIVLIFWGSGFGFTVMLDDFKNAYAESGLSGITQVLADPPHEYTHLDNRTGGKPSEKDTDDNIVWIVPSVSFLAHQRSFVLGLTLFTMIMLGIFYYGEEKSFWRFGAIAGILPFAHGHTLIALFVFMAALFLYFRKSWRAWIFFALLATALAAPQIYYFLSSSDIAHADSFRPWFGWMTCEHATSWLYCDPPPSQQSDVFIFWAKNFGLIFVIWAIYVLISAGKLYASDHKFLFASLALFTVPNLFLFQPWPFDNNKLFFYWWITAILFAVIPALQFIAKQQLVGKALAVILVLFSVLAGGFDAMYRLFGSKESSYYGYADGSQQNRELASWISANTKPNDLFLTNIAVDPVPTFLAGRPVYLAFEGWLWSQGLDYHKNVANAKIIAGGNAELACKEKIKFIILDQNLKKSFPTTNEAALLPETNVVFEQALSARKVLEIRCDK